MADPHSLFDHHHNHVPSEDRRWRQIAGLTYMPDYITEAEHDTLIERIQNEPWIVDFKRRVQHYGYRYDYKARQINHAMRVGPLPPWLQKLAERLHADSYSPAVPDQVIINEYLPGQGIADHVDCEPCFGDTVISLSLGSGCTMHFTRKVDRERVSLWLAPRSIVTLKGSARYDWMHGIPARKSDTVDGQKVERGMRFSLTFRTVIVND